MDKNSIYIMYFQVVVWGEGGNIPTVLSHAEAMLTSQTGRYAHIMTSSHADITSHFCQPQVMRPMSDAAPAVFSGLLYLSG